MLGYKHRYILYGTPWKQFDVPNFRETFNGHHGQQAAPQKVSIAEKDIY
jgi:hypothetical protein